ncbi:MAG TPA: MlaD family protein [Candidatus Tectomicrobia bacterium]|nr:MlaD family protein [Candidatus Tectomicrobia bacterium]
MMVRQRSAQVRVGIFVFFTLITFMAAIFLLGSRTQYFQPQYTLKAVFSNVGYLLEGAGVYLAGVQVGRVGEIRFFEDVAAQKVLVALKIARDFQERIRQDSVAVITSSGLLGDKYIDITLGSESEPELLDGMFIRTEEPADYSQLLRQGEAVLKNTIEITSAMADLTSGFRSSQAPMAVADLLTSLAQIAKTIETGDGLLHSLIYDKGNERIFADVAAATAALRDTLTGIKEGKGFLQTLLTDPNPEVVAQLTHLVASAQKLLQDIDKGQGLLHALIYDKQGGKAVRDFASAAGNLNELLVNLQGRDGLLASLLNDPKQKQVLTDLGHVMHDFRQIASDIAEGRGTVGGFIKDPTLYENLTALLEGARRSWILRTVIQSTVNKGQGPER